MLFTIKEWRYEIACNYGDIYKYSFFFNLYSCYLTWSVCAYYSYALKNSWKCSWKKVFSPSHPHRSKVYELAWVFFEISKLQMFSVISTFKRYSSKKGLWFTVFLQIKGNCIAYSLNWCYSYYFQDMHIF